jgi:hypothetical protein
MLKTIIAGAGRYLSGRSDLGPRANILYLKPMRDRPTNYGGANTNAVYEPYAMRIRNLRRLHVAPALEVQGFTLVNAPSAVDDFYDDAQVLSQYYRETERLVEQVTGASRVVVIDHITRRRPVDDPSGAIPGKSRRPVIHVHVDYTLNSAELAVRHAKEVGECDLPEGRVRIVNVWRPIRGPLSDMPLALCDARTVETADLVPTDMVYPGKVWETYSVTANSRHQWFYAPLMTKDEALLFKCFDSEEDSRARFTPHAAFYDPAASEHAIPRESIEVRTLVFG